MNRRTRLVSLLILALAACVLVGGCVSIKNVDDDQIPRAWREAMSVKPVAPVEIGGVFAGEGDSIRSDGKPQRGQLRSVFFPGQHIVSDRVDLQLIPGGRLTVIAFRNGHRLAEVTLPCEFDIASGAMLIKSIPITNDYKFGAKFAGSQSAQLFLGADHALYAKVRNSGAGTVFIVPAVGTASWWGRWTAVSD